MYNLNWLCEIEARKAQNLIHYNMVVLWHLIKQDHFHPVVVYGDKNHPIVKNIFAKNCVRFGIPRIVNDCPNSTFYIR